VLAAGLVLARRARRDAGLIRPGLLGAGPAGAGPAGAGPGGGAEPPTRLARTARAVVAVLPPALAGAGVLLGLGTVLVLVAVGLRAGEVAELGGATGAAGVGTVLLTLAQVAVLPNLGLWAVSWLAGPGFTVLDGAPTTWAGGAGGELPLVPVLAALPPPGDFPGWVPVVVLVPVAVGAWVGHRAQRRVPRRAPRKARLTAALWAAGLAAVLLGVLDALAGGPLGTYRLASVGAPAPWLVLALAVEMAVGAVAAVLVEGRRR
jgi:hypothetical protein